jgi:hypothetical protein
MSGVSAGATVAQMQAQQQVVAAGGGAGMSIGLRGLASAVKLHKGRIKESTINGYKSHLKTMCVYIVSLMDLDDCVCGGRKDLVKIEGQGDAMQLELSVPVPDTVLTAFFGHIHSDKYLRDMTISARVAHLHKPKVLKKNANTNICSASFFRGYKSALKWWYTEKGADLGDNIDAIIRGVTAGQQRDVAKAKDNGDMVAIEGRLPLSATGYRVVCLALSKLADFNMSLFAWPFLVWSWNLMVRPINVGHLKFSDISWVHDCMEVLTSVEKTKQAGTNEFYRRHVYYNLDECLLCPVFTLALLVFCRSFRPSDFAKEMFLGQRSEERFNSAIKSCIDKALNDEERLHLGAAVEYLGGYMSRKGCTSFVASMPGGPTYASWMLRAGWAMGVQGRYVHMVEGGGDEFLGRVLTMVSLFDGQKFAALPARFKRSDVAKLFEEDCMPTVLEMYAELPPTFKPVVPFLLARLVYSWEWVQSNLPEGHPIFASRLVTSGVINRLRQLSVLTGYGECKDYNMAVRVHPSIIEQIKAEEGRQFQKECEEKSIKRHEELMEGLSKLPERVVSSGNGAAAVQEFVRAEVQKMHESLAALKDAIARRDLQSGLRGELRGQQPAVRPRGQMQSWNGRMHPVSQGFRLKGDTVKSFWDCYFFGDDDQEGVAYHKLRGFDLQTDLERNLLAKGRAAVAWLLQLYNDSDEGAVDAALTVADVARMERATADDVFASAFQEATEAMSYTYSNARVCEVQLASFYKRMIRHRSKE